MRDTTYVGMDAHAASIRVAVLRPGAEQADEWQLVNEPRGVKRLARRVTRMAAGPVLACYEAGPCGFALQRQLQAEGLRCQVIAPALIPRRPGDRVKTDRRDARQLAELLRAELLTVGHPPTPDQEAVHDLCRAREDAVTDRTRARHRLAKLLLRQGIAYDGRRWTHAHRRWLLTLRFEHPAAQGHLRRLSARAGGRGGATPHAGAATHRGRGQGRRRRGGGSAALLPRGRHRDGDDGAGRARRYHAFRPRPAADVIPGPHTERVQQRRAAAAGADHADRQRARAAGAGGGRVARPPPATWRVARRQRRIGQPGWAVAVADRAQQRLHRRYRRLVGHGKPATVANVAVARELAGALWAVRRIHAARCRTA